LNLFMELFRTSRSTSEK